MKKRKEGRILYATIGKNTSDKVFTSILCEEEIAEFPQTNSAIGIDVESLTLQFFLTVKRLTRAQVAKKKGIHLV